MSHASFALAIVSMLSCGRSSREDAKGGSSNRGGTPSGGSGSGGDGGEANPSGGTPSGGSDSGGDAGEANPSGGTSGSGAGTAGSSVGGAGDGGTSGSGGTAGSSAGSGGSVAGSGGQGGTVPGRPGIVCGPWDAALPDVNCAAGEVCVLCEESETNRSVRCAPNPSERPDEYEDFSESCTNPVLFTECDGPEDCSDDTLCQLRSDDSYSYGVCSAEPPTCSAYCVACNSNEDCEGDACVPNSFNRGQWRGATCGPALNELLLDGDWLVGWTGGNDHYNWYRFTRDASDSRKGTVKTLALSRGGYPQLGCAVEGEGTYEVVAETNVVFEFPASCTFSFGLSDLKSPPDMYDSAPGVEGLVSARVTLDDMLDSATATLYAPGVACNVDFSTCTFPPP